MIVEDSRLDFEGLVLVVFVAIKQDVVHSETPGVEVVIVPAVDKFRSCSYEAQLAVDWNGFNALDVDVVLFKSMRLCWLLFSLLFYFFCRFFFILSFSLDFGFRIFAIYLCFNLFRLGFLVTVIEIHLFLDFCF